LVCAAWNILQRIPGSLLIVATKLRVNFEGMPAFREFVQYLEMLARKSEAFDFVRTCRFGKIGVDSSEELC
jgi:hypothetical protein